MKWDAKKPMVPFNRNHMLDWAPSSYGNSTVEWVELQPFYAQSMEFVGYSRGQSSTKFDVEDENGLQYPIFVSDLFEILKSGNIYSGVIYGEVWKAAKKGANYGIRLVQN